MKVKTGYASDTKEWQKSAYAFGRHDIWDVLVGVNRRDSGNVKNSSGRRIDNNSDAEYTSVIAKVSALPTDEMAFSLAYNFDEAQDEWGRQDRWFYKNKQNRITGKWDFNSGPLLNLSAAVQYVDSTFSFDSGIKKAQNNFDSIGGNLQNTFEFSAAGQHALTVGGDIYKNLKAVLKLTIPDIGSMRPVGRIQMLSMRGCLSKISTRLPITLRSRPCFAGTTISANPIPDSPLFRIQSSRRV